MRVSTAGAAAIVLSLLALAAVGCGSDEDTSEAQQQAAEERRAEERRQEAREERLQEARERREAARRLARREAARERAREAAAARAREEAEAEERHEEESGAEAVECDPNYEGACLDPNASDYDCEGGGGDGPYYTGPVAVVGSDPHGLDRDGDGYACE